MVNRYSKRSLDNLKSCHSQLQVLFWRVLEVYDHAITFGFRDEEEQNAAFEAGNSTKPWPESRHNNMPSTAVDAVPGPWPIDWDHKERYYYFAGIVMGIAHELGIGVIWGGDWDDDKDLRDQKLMDLVHFELTDAEVAHG